MKTNVFGTVVTLAFFCSLLMATTAKATSYTLTVGPQGSGIVTKNPNNGTYPSGVTVTLTATPNTGWYFSNWSGDTNGSVNPLNVTMNANLVITGNFLAFPTYALTLITNAQGTIALDPASGTYQSNSIVTATATPAAGWVFIGWSGVTNTSANPLSFVVNANASLTGNFAQLPAFDVEPVGVTNTAGSTVSFIAHSVGTAPVNYQWFFSGGSLNNATTSTLTLTNTTSIQAGNYWSVATNNYGSATSHVASLTLTNSYGPTNVVYSPDQASLLAAIELGGWVGFGFNGTITLTNTINITNDVILDGNNVAVTVSGGNAVRLFNIAPDASLTISNLTLANGFVSSSVAQGGAIFNNGGTVALISCTLTNNYAQAGTGSASGGAIYVQNGSLFVFNSGISNNTVAPGPDSVYSLANSGGAIFNTNGTIIIVGCNFSGNLCMGSPSSYPSYGGAIFQSSGTLSASNSIFAFNQSLGGNGYSQGQGGVSGYGGALSVNGGSVIIDDCQFLGNTTLGGIGLTSGNGFGGAIYSTAMLSIESSIFSQNQALPGNPGYYYPASGQGGAIYNSGLAQFNCCALYSNYVQGSTAGDGKITDNGGDGLGGGIFNASLLNATNCTIALNSAMAGSGLPAGGFFPAYSATTNGAALGGGIYNSVNATSILMNVTIASNYCIANGSGFQGEMGVAAGSQIANANGTLRLHNSLIAGTNSNAYGPITDDGYDICSDGTAQLFGGTSYNFTDPKIGPLADYGGPTLCMSLLPDSPAIDYADISNFPPTDQRGFVRPIGDGPDVGAFEYGSYPLEITYLSINYSAGNLTLSYNALPAKLYLLQTSTNLTTWTDLNSNGPFASSTNISQTISAQGFDVRFFKLQVQ